MLEYLDTAIVNAGRQIIGGFGIIFVFAFLMWTVSQKRRGMGAGFWGRSYYYFVAPFSGIGTLKVCNSLVHHYACLAFGSYRESAYSEVGDITGGRQTLAVVH